MHGLGVAAMELWGEVCRSGGFSNGLAGQGSSGQESNVRERSKGSGWIGRHRYGSKGKDSPGRFWTALERTGPLGNGPQRQHGRGSCGVVSKGTERSAG